MNNLAKALLGAGITFPLCAIIATPVDDPFTMLVLGLAGAVGTFFILWWIFSRPSCAGWNRRRQIVLTAVTSACVTLGMCLYSWSRLNRSEAVITGVALRCMQGTATPFHGYYVADGVTNRVRGMMPTNFPCSGHSLRFEFFCDQRETQDVELVISRSDGSTDTSRWRNRIRGQRSQVRREDGSYEWFSQNESFGK